MSYFLSGVPFLSQSLLLSIASLPNLSKSHRPCSLLNTSSSPKQKPAFRKGVSHTSRLHFSINLLTAHSLDNSCHQAPTFYWFFHLNRFSEGFRDSSCHAKDAEIRAQPLPFARSLHQETGPDEPFGIHQASLECQEELRISSGESQRKPDTATTLKVFTPSWEVCKGFPSVKLEVIPKHSVDRGSRGTQSSDKHGYH